MFSHGNYEVTYKAETYPPRSFSDPKIKEKVMVVEADSISNARMVAKETLKKQGYNFSYICNVKFLKHTDKQKTSVSEKNEIVKTNNNSSQTSEYNPAVAKFLLILVGIVGGLVLLISIVMLTLKAIFV